MNIDRSFYWSNFHRVPSFALLDRFFASGDWDRHFSDVVVMSRPRVGSDHYPLILDTSLGSFHNTPVTRFEKVWAEQDDLNKAITRWWNSLP